MLTETTYKINWIVFSVIIKQWDIFSSTYTVSFSETEIILFVNLSWTHIHLCRPGPNVTIEINGCIKIAEYIIYATFNRWYILHNFTQAQLARPTNTKYVHWFGCRYNVSLDSLKFNNYFLSSFLVSMQSFCFFLGYFTP